MNLDILIKTNDHHSPAAAIQHRVDSREYTEIISLVPSGTQGKMSVAEGLQLRVLTIFAKSSSSTSLGVLSAIATLITILTPIAAIIGLFWKSTGSIAAIILAIYVCLLTTALLIFAIYQEANYRRETRYAGAMIPARKAFHALADATWTLIDGDGAQKATQDMFRLQLRESLGFLAEVFTFVLDQPCRASVKMIAAEAAGSATSRDISDIPVITVCRNSEEPSRRQLALDTARDRIGNNTDFKKIFLENEFYFFCNDLPAQLGKGYQNSHWNEEIIQYGNFDYRSTIVWPIGPPRLSPTQGTQTREIIGFLCIDTLATNAFHETYDVPLGAAYAQVLHLALRRFRASQSTVGG